MTGIDKEKLKQGIDAASPEQLEQILAILGVQNDTKAQTDNITNSVVAEPSTSEPVEAAQVQVENVEVDPRLTKFAEMYMKWSRVSKNRMKWKRVQTALLANDAELLKKVETIPNGPIMFGADEIGNILFANGGVAPILVGDIYKRVKEKVSSLGFSLFPVNIYQDPPGVPYRTRSFHQYVKSAEMLMFEEFTGHPIVASEDGETLASIWLESGNPTIYGPMYATAANFSPESKSVYIREYDAVLGSQRGFFSDGGRAIDYNLMNVRGVRILLRAKA